MLVQLVIHMSVFSRCWWNDERTLQLTPTSWPSPNLSTNEWLILTDVEWLKMKMLNSNIDGFQVRICETMRVVFLHCFCWLEWWRITGVCVCVRVWYCIFGTHLYRIGWEHWKWNVHMCVQFRMLPHHSTSAKSHWRYLTRFIDNQHQSTQSDFQPHVSQCLWRWEIGRNTHEP